MNQRKKKSSQKQFMETMIITGILGLSVMIIVTLYMIKLFGPKKAVVVPEAVIPITDNKSKEDLEGEEVRGVVYDISATRNNMKVWDIQEKQHIKMYIKDKTQITDSYGKPMSIQEIELGDIVEVTYETKTKDVLILQKSAKAWVKSEVLGIEVNPQNKTIKIGNMEYDYTSDIIIMNNKLELVDIMDINHLDTLMVKGIDDTIWSMQVVQAAGYLKLSNMPTIKGTIEIGNNKIYRLEEIEENMPLPGGKHKIVIRMDGYKPFVKHINIVTNEIQELDLKEAEEIIATLKVKVLNADIDYKIQIDHKTYLKDEIIQVKPGQYTLKIAADGFNTFERDIQLQEGDQKINITLQVEDKEEMPAVGGQTSVPENSTPVKPKSETPAPEKPKPEPTVEEIKTVQIVIETDPADAQVFVSGVYKGTTPTLTGLKPGEYNLTIEKEGYSSLYSTIIIDASNAQKGFLYTLQKE